MQWGKPERQGTGTGPVVHGQVVQQLVARGDGVDRKVDVGSLTASKKVVKGLEVALGSPVVDGDLLAL